MTAATTPARTPAPATVDPLARQLPAALVIGLLLILPLFAALGTKTNGALTSWILGAMVGVLGIGYLLRWAEVPRARALALATAGVFAIAAIVGIWIMTTVDEPADDVGVAMIVGIAAAALATVVGVTIVQQAGDYSPAIAILCAVIGVMIAIGGGTSAAEALDEARDDAALRAEFEEAGLTAYAPEIEGMSAEFSGTTYHDAETGLASGYNLVYRPDDAGSAASAAWASATIDVKVAVDEPGCEAVVDSTTCRDSGGYVVEEYDGVLEAVHVSMGSTSLIATFDEDGEGELPDVDTVGEALAAAEYAEWGDVFALRD